MKNIVNKIISKVFGKPKKFFPVVDEKGFAEKPKKFFSLTEREYFLEMRRNGKYGNGICNEQDF